MSQINATQFPPILADDTGLLYFCARNEFNIKSDDECVYFINKPMVQSACFTETSVLVKTVVRQNPASKSLIRVSKFGENGYSTVMGIYRAGQELWPVVEGEERIFVIQRSEFYYLQGNKGTVYIVLSIEKENCDRVSCQLCAVGKKLVRQVTVGDQKNRVNEYEVDTTVGKEPKCLEMTFHVIHTNNGMKYCLRNEIFEMTRDPVIVECLDDEETLQNIFDDIPTWFGDDDIDIL